LHDFVKKVGEKDEEKQRGVYEGIVDKVIDRRVLLLVRS
jgi:hypothetical protein